MLRKSGSSAFAIVALTALGLAIGIAGSASAATFTLNSSNGGDGSVTLFPGGFNLFGSNNGVGEVGNPSLTTYLATATATATLTYKWSYGTEDIDGPEFDWAGYVLNDVFTQLTNDDGPLSQNGVVTFTVLAGQNYGFYVDSFDSLFGRAHIAVNETPLPATLLLFASGLGLLRWFSRGRMREVVAPLVAT